ncbi:Hydroxysteroid dehydrogenase-like protein 2 [Geodia barretti]|uniref:Hydroxysteroid dehydrogenase-like protein 2 n=1 Tax=Geodia barretti TaxID=519541 RepID=A0AA35S399_GEOBA|nr:Hydroxysteroid dehydrogenase-like protein 2 [Geodia barretti]
MFSTGKLAGCTLFITGASRGIGKAIALRAARDGANIVIAAKTAEPHPKLPGTVYTAAEEVEKAGGKCLPCVVDIRDEGQLENAVQQTVDRFGGIDIVVNNASAIHLTGTVNTPMKRYDLMMGVNVRGTFLTSKLCIPHLHKSSNPHILNISPPLNMSPRWFSDHCGQSSSPHTLTHDPNSKSTFMFPVVKKNLPFIFNKVFFVLHPVYSLVDLSYTTSTSCYRV